MERSMSLSIKTYTCISYAISCECSACAYAGTNISTVYHNRIRHQIYSVQCIYVTRLQLKYDICLTYFLIFFAGICLFSNDRNAAIP